MGVGFKSYGVDLSKLSQQAYPARKQENLLFGNVKRPLIDLVALVLTPSLVENYPSGYPRVAAFIDSDENFMIYRRFGVLHSRIILQKQDELREIEESLVSLDNQDYLGSEQARECLKSRSKDERRTDSGEQGSRRLLLEKAEKKALEYGQDLPRCPLLKQKLTMVTGRLLLQAQQLAAMNRPTSRHGESLQSYMEGGDEQNLRPLHQADTEFVYRTDDLVTLRPGRGYSWLEVLVEKVLEMIWCKPIQVYHKQVLIAGEWSLTRLLHFEVYI